MNKDRENKKYPFYFYIIALLIPVLFFTSAELFLRVVSYGYSIPQWIHPSDHYPDYIVLNHDITKRYFQNMSGIPSPTYDGFSEIKRKNTFRVFVMGGSTTAGFPYTINGSFSRYIRHYLQIKYPKMNIEVINLGISAVNSYTVRDLMPGVIEKEPDLVIIYAGHNEYYGALGVGSAEFLGTARSLVNFLIAVNDYRVVQLMRNIIQSVGSLFAESNGNKSDQTLMSRMVNKQRIPYQSDLYYDGLDQFNGNLHDIMTMLQEHNIPVILSTVTSNLKDQPPFISVDTGNFPPADSVFNRAQKIYSEGDFERAASLFLQSKDLDALRFRAPDSLNAIIMTIGNEFAVPVVFMDSIFRKRSKNKITGNDLFIDHVHPTINGYRLMGSAFVEKMEKTGLVPDEESIVSENIQVKIRNEMTLTALDSIAALLRINYLKNGWPFVKNSGKNYYLYNYKAQTHIENLAYDIVLKKINWEEAHLKAAIWYRDNGKKEEFVLEMKAIIENIPLNPQPFKLLIDGLIQFQRIEEAYPYLLEYDRLFPGAYSKKWLGTYHLYKKNYKEAIKFLSDSFNIYDKDPQLLYNLAGAFYYNKDVRMAMESIKKCLALSPDFPGARIMYRDLLKIEDSK
jgi:lysophospholipase L1-like esterase